MRTFRNFLRNLLLNSKVILALVVSVCCFFIVIFFFLRTPEQLPATGGGKWQVDPSNLVIMIGSSATLPESTAAADLKSYIASQTGVTPGIVTDTYTGSKQIISVGMPTTSSEISSFVQNKSLPKYDGYTIDIPSSGKIHICSQM